MQYHWIRRIFIIMIIFSITYTFFTNVLSSQKLDNLAYVVSIGIDEGSVEKYKLTFQISTVKSSSSGATESSQNDSGSSSSGSTSMPSYATHSVECSSIDMGISLMNSYINKQLNLSHCKVVVLSEAIAKNGVRSIVYNFVNKIEIRPDCNIMICQIPEQEFKDEKKPVMEEILPKFFDLTTNTEEEETEYFESITLNDFYVALENPLAEPYCSVGIVNNTKNDISITNQKAIGIDKTRHAIASQDEEIMVEMIGLSVFKDDIMVGYLSGMETICHFILSDNLEQSIISIPSPFEQNDTVNLYISITKKPNIAVYIDNRSAPFVKIEADLIRKVSIF